MNITVKFFDKQAEVETLLLSGPHDVLLTNAEASPLISNNRKHLLLPTDKLASSFNSVRLTWKPGSNVAFQCKTLCNRNVFNSQIIIIIKSLEVSLLQFIYFYSFRLLLYIDVPLYFIYSSFYHNNMQHLHFSSGDQ